MGFPKYRFLEYLMQCPTSYQYFKSWFPHRSVSLLLKRCQSPTRSQDVGLETPISLGSTRAVRVTLSSKCEIFSSDMNRLFIFYSRTCSTWTTKSNGVVGQRMKEGCIIQYWYYASVSTHELPVAWPLYVLDSWTGWKTFCFCHISSCFVNWVTYKIG